MVVVRCEEVWAEISNYLEGDVSPEWRIAMEEHFRGCKHCAAIANGTRNLIQIYGDERMVELPAGFSQRLRRRLEENMPRQKGNAWGWMVAFAMAAMLLVAFEVGNSSAFTHSPLRDKLAKQGSGVPADLMVVVAEDGKTFHVAGCTFIHDKAHLRTITASEAMREGYVPCIRCMKRYLGEEAAGGIDREEDEVAATEHDEQ
jgi:hypothetical protein